MGYLIIRQAQKALLPSECLLCFPFSLLAATVGGQYTGTSRPSGGFATPGGRSVGGGYLLALRADKEGPHRGAFEKNKKRILATQTVCGICGKPVDFSLKYPHPLAPCVDHIIPIARGGHPSDIDNLQLAHWTCNRQKSDKLVDKVIVSQTEETISNRVLPQSMDWTEYNPNG